jgi:hypothetical protein
MARFQLDDSFDGFDRFDRVPGETFGGSGGIGGVVTPTPTPTPTSTPTPTPTPAPGGTISTPGDTRIPLPTGGGTTPTPTPTPTPAPSGGGVTPTPTLTPTPDLPPVAGFTNGVYAPQNDSVVDAVNRVTSSGNPLMQRAAGIGAAVANSRGLQNSSIAAQSAEKAALDAAVPIASQEASQANQKNLQFMQGRNSTGIAQLEAENQRALQASSEREYVGIAKLQSDTQKQTRRSRRRGGAGRVRAGPPRGEPELQRQRQRDHVQPGHRRRFAHVGARQAARSAMPTTA